MPSKQPSLSAPSIPFDFARFGLIALCVAFLLVLGFLLMDMFLADEAAVKFIQSYLPKRLVEFGEMVSKTLADLVKVEQQVPTWGYPIFEPNYALGWRVNLIFWPIVLIIAAIIERKFSAALARKAK